MRVLLIAALGGLLLVSACGKKGDPKPTSDPAAQTENSKKKPAQ